MSHAIRLTYKNSDIHVVVFGHGSRTLLAFHGFGESGSAFLALEPALASTYTVYALDLPYHGNTMWRETAHFSTADLHDILLLLLDRIQVSTFDLLGFSMGGKCAMYATKFFADRVEVLWLLASDGIRTNRMYNIAVYPWWGRHLFKTTIDHPGWFFGIVHAAHKLKAISPWLKKFTMNHMDTREKRLRLYNTWISMSTFNPDLQKVRSTIMQHHITTCLIFGKRDEVIPPDVGADFAAGLPKAHFFAIDRGHYFIDQRLNPVLEDILPQLFHGNA